MNHWKQWNTPVFSCHLLIFFLNWHQISFFPFIRKLTSFENYLKRFQNRLPIKLSNTEIKSPISNIWIMVCSSCFSSMFNFSFIIPFHTNGLFQYSQKTEDKRELDDIGQRSLLSLLQLDAATRGVAVKSLKACNYIKKRLLHRCFPVNTAKFSRTFWITSVNSCLFLSGHDRQQWFTLWEKILLIFIDFAMVELI